MNICPRCGGQLFLEKLEKNTLDTVCLQCSYREIKIFYAMAVRQQKAMRWKQQTKVKVKHLQLTVAIECLSINRNKVTI